MRKEILLVLLFACLYEIGFTQDFRKGYVIQLNGDTISGFVKFKGDHANSQSCTFKNNHGEVKEFTPKEIKGYRFSQGKYYISKNIRENAKVQCVFVEFLVEGKKSLYFVRNKGFHFYIDPHNDTLIEVPYKEELVYRNGEYYTKKSSAKTVLLKSYFKEAPSLFPFIDRLGRPEIGNMISLTRKYHLEACNDSGCIVYHKKTPLSIYIEPQTGLVRYKQGLYGSQNLDYSQFGASIYVWMPNSSEYLFFKTGLLITKSTQLTTYRVPIQFEYLFGTGNIQPKIDVGVNYYTWAYERSRDHFLTLACSVGVVVKLSNYVSFDLAISSDITDFINTAFVSYSAETGLRFRLTR